MKFKLALSDTSHSFVMIENQFGIKRLNGYVVTTGKIEKPVISILDMSFSVQKGEEQDRFNTWKAANKPESDTEEVSKPPIDDEYEF